MYDTTMLTAQLCNDSARSRESSHCWSLCCATRPTVDEDMPSGYLDALSKAVDYDIDKQLPERDKTLFGRD